MCVHNNAKAFSYIECSKLSGTELISGCTQCNIFSRFLGHVKTQKVCRMCRKYMQKGIGKSHVVNLFPRVTYLEIVPIIRGLTKYNLKVCIHCCFCKSINMGMCSFPVLLCYGKENNKSDITRTKPQLCTVEWSIFWKATSWKLWSHWFTTNKTWWVGLCHHLCIWKWKKSYGCCDESFNMHRWFRSG